MVMNMRRIFPFLLSLMVITATQAQDFKCATVDVNKLLTEYNIAMKEITLLKGEREKYDKDREGRMSTLTGVETKIKDLITKLKSKAMPKTERDTLMEEYQDLVSQHNALSKDLKESDRDQVQEIKKKMASATRRLLDEIHVVVQKYAKEHKYTWIMDTSGLSNTQISPLVYARDTKDVTKEILTILNKDAPKAEPIEENEGE